MAEDGWWPRPTTHTRHSMHRGGMGMTRFVSEWMEVGQGAASDRHTRTRTHTQGPAPQNPVNGARPPPGSTTSQAYPPLDSPGNESCLTVCH